MDTGPFIACERARLTALETLRVIYQRAESEVLLVSAVTYMELMQGIARAETRERAERRRAFLSDIFSCVGVQPFTKSIAATAAALRGGEEQQGNTLPFADALIAATALATTGTILTTNVRDFSRVPGLRVRAFSVS